ncbi:MAG TPA: phosphoenolpyruvate carboxykinase (ATP) [Chloroflexota bacterium]|jgi:phosphoenolpyruvate carboxykinase (ATP)|nr:phosphoenolpyruvate carboxykinase (ATP) [Chloroflexota bacterium]
MVQTPTRTGLEQHGIQHPANVFWNLPAPALYEVAVQRREGLIAQGGPLVFRTSPYTGRSPQDKFVVHEPSSSDHVWWGAVNQALSDEHFEALHRDVVHHLDGRDIYVQDLSAAADPRYRLPVRIISELPYHSLFSRNMFIRPALGTPVQAPEFTVIAAPSFQAEPERLGLRTGTFIVINFGRRLVLVGGTSYAGEIKKAIFSVMNYLLPLRDVLSMHCSANRGTSEDVALFFGLSGTGKTSLSTVHDRVLIGDDEHGWSDEGVFNIEGGSYAKTIRISARAEPEIYGAVHRFGTVLENVVVDPETRMLDLDSDELTENTRAAYPIDFLPNVELSGRAGHPRNVIFLTADAFGVFPPISRLSRDQALYYFLSGYTAKVAGTERGVSEPQPNFSTCFGSPFLTLPPATYARLLGERLDRHGSNVWLINTGWTGGPYGVGSRINIDLTRAMVAAALDGSLESVAFRKGHRSHLDIPEQVPGVPPEVLDQRETWADQAAYDAQAKRLAGMFAENFKKFSHDISEDVASAGPDPS